MAALTTSAPAAASKPSTSNHPEPGPSSVSFRGSSVPTRSRKAAESSASSSGSSQRNYTTWLLIDVDHNSSPFLRTLHTSEAPLASGSTSPAARSAEKLTESTNTTSSSSKSAAGNSVKSQASKFENASNTEANGAGEKDGGSTGRRGFMSRLRGTGGSVSGAGVFSPPNSAGANGAQMSNSGSWSIVDPPTPIKEHPNQAEDSGCKPARTTVHLALTQQATKSAIDNAEGLVSRSSLLASSAAEPQGIVEELHTERLDTKALVELANQLKPEAIFFGSAHKDSTQPYIEALLSNPPALLKLLLLDPALVRTLTPTTASTLHDTARSKNVSLPLPIRWSSLWTPNIEETLLGLELLHDVQQEQSPAAVNGNGDPDVSVEKSFDISMSNIPTGLSGRNLNELAEFEALKGEVERLKAELAAKDAKISQLNKQVEEERMSKVEPKTPDRTRTTALLSPSPAAPVPAQEITSPSIRTPTAAPTSNTTPAELAIPTTAQPLANITQPRITPQLGAPVTITSPSTPATTLGTGLSLSSPSQTRSPSGTGKVISDLTSELNELKTVLTATRTALSTSKTQAAQFQAQAEEMRSTLSRARLENDSSITILARKDRQISEALERARKAETEAKELGRASREWGTRVREVEEELGKERIKRARAEQSYEALSGEWKGVRDRLVGEVKELREEHKKSLEELSEEYRKLLGFKNRLRDEFGLSPTTDGAGAEGEVGMQGPKKLVQELKQLNQDMQTYLTQQIDPLLERQKELEKRENEEIVDRLKYLTDELNRYKTLMRRGEVRDASQVPPLSVYPKP